LFLFLVRGALAYAAWLGWVVITTLPYPSGIKTQAPFALATFA